MSNKITISNYEVYMIDYLDGTLSKEREAELMLFLEAHPHLKEELIALDEMVLVPDQAVFEFRDGLKKSILDSGMINTDNFQEFCVAFYEGDLTEIEQKYLQNFLHNHPSFIPDFQVYVKLKLAYDKDIYFTDKDMLKQFASISSEAISEDNYMDFLIAQNEGDLSRQRILELNQFLNVNPQYIIEAQQIARLKLKADKRIIFENKSKLKHKILIFTIANKWMNVAAVWFAVFLIFYSLLPRYDYENKEQNITRPVRSIDKTTVVAIKPENKETTAKHQYQTTKSHNKSHKPRSKSQAELIIKSERFMSIEPKDCKRIERNAKINIEQLHFPVDVLAHVDDNKEKKSVEKTIVLDGYAGKFVGKIGKLLGKTDRLKKERLKGQLHNMAELALQTFNKMTEADWDFPSLTNTDKVEE